MRRMRLPSDHRHRATDAAGLSNTPAADFAADFVVAAAYRLLSPTELNPHTTMQPRPVLPAAGLSCKTAARLWPEARPHDAACFRRSFCRIPDLPAPSRYVPADADDAIW